MIVNGIIVAHIAVVANTEAEYGGILAVLKHALSLRCPRVCSFGYSKLGVSQLVGIWRCNAGNLFPYNEEGLQLTRQLPVTSNVFQIKHVYREFYADADSLANLAIARWTGATSAVASDNCASSCLDQIVLLASQ